MRKDFLKNIKGTVGPHDAYCSSGGFSSDDAYLVFPSISCGITKSELSHSGSKILDEIIAFDKAEGEDVNLTQTNMVTVSSFCGIRGGIVGYDILPQKLSRHPIFGDKYRAVYDMSPLTDAGRAIFGTIKEKRFPIEPGQHLLCANKTVKAHGPTTIYGALALGIPDDRDHNADLFMEDCGTIMCAPGRDVSKDAVTLVLENIVHSVYKIGLNIGVHYEKIFVSFKSARVKADEVGCALIAAPYFRLAKKAVPRSGVRSMLSMSVEEWEKSIRIRNDS